MLVRACSERRRYYESLPGTSARTRYINTSCHRFILQFEQAVQSRIATAELLWFAGFQLKSPAALVYICGELT